MRTAESAVLLFKPGSLILVKDDELVDERHDALIPVIAQYDAIFMQEVILESWLTIKAGMPNYLHFEGISTGKRIPMTTVIL